jgi:hypothetical protein
VPLIPSSSALSQLRISSGYAASIFCTSILSGLLDFGKVEKDTCVMALSA